jgi:hypothetical protein
MPNVLKPSREAEPRRNHLGEDRRARLAREMTHEAWAPPEDLQRARKWLTGPIATDDYGNEIPNDSSSLLSMLNSLVPHPGQPEEQIIQNTAGVLLPSGGLGPLKELARGPVRETALRIFAGPGAKTADHNALAQAMKMAEGGADNETIRAATNWFQGPDQKWRFEIDDSGSVPGPRTSGEKASLNEGTRTATTRQRALLHPKLSAAYPDTKKLGITLDPDGAQRGTYWPALSNAVPEHIRVGMEWAPAGFKGHGDQAADRSLMLHELQHAIQQRENFARGGSPESAIAPLYDEMDKRLELIGGKMTGTTGKERAALRDEYEKILEAKASANPYEAYMRLAGEVEARDVQARMDFTPEQRRATAPYSSQGIAPEDMTINFLGGENKARRKAGL